MKPFTRVTRIVVRAPMRCDYCPWQLQPYDSAHARVIGGVVIGRYCNYEHARLSTRGPIRCEYE